MYQRQTGECLGHLETRSAVALFADSECALQVLARDLRHAVETVNGPEFLQRLPHEWLYAAQAPNNRQSPQIHRWTAVNEAMYLGRTSRE